MYFTFWRYLLNVTPISITHYVWNSRNTETYCSSMTRVGISHVYASVSTRYLSWRKTSSITQRANGIVQGERKIRSRNCIPIVTSRYRNHVDIDNRAKRSIEIPEAETFLVRGKLSQASEESQLRKFAFLALTFSRKYPCNVNSRKFTDMTHTWDNLQKPIVVLHNECVQQSYGTYRYR